MLLSYGEQMVVAVLPAHKRLDVKKLKRLCGYKYLRSMEKKAIEAQTGLVVGAAAPIGRGLDEVPLFVDPSLFEEGFLDISNGNPNAGLELHWDILKKLLKEGTLVSIMKEEVEVILRSIEKFWETS